MTQEYTPAALRFAQSAYMAQECIKCVHDLTSLETAGQALLYFSGCMVEIAVEDQELARKWSNDVPLLDHLAKAFCAAASTLAERVSTLQHANAS